MHGRTVLYLDLDDTIIAWHDRTPAGAPGVREFLLWSLDTFEVRWLTRWARDGRMDERLVQDLARMSGVPADLLAQVQGLDWHETDCKLNGIAWLEHVVGGRPFIWIEDETIGTRATDFLVRTGFGDAYQCCNVSTDPDALLRLHERLREQFGSDAQDAA